MNNLYKIFVALALISGTVFVFSILLIIWQSDDLFGIINFPYKLLGSSMLFLTVFGLGTVVINGYTDN